GARLRIHAQAGRRLRCHPVRRTRPAGCDDTPGEIGHLARLRPAMNETAGDKGQQAMTDEVSEVRLQPVDSVRTRLSVVWFSGALVILLLVAVQTLNGRYGDHTQEVWTWLLPN